MLQAMYEEILEFWFEEIDQRCWWKKDTELDRLIVDRFSQTHDKATRGELFEWRNTARGRLAEIIVLDQFSRNMYRNSPGAFAYDAVALVLSQEAIFLGSDNDLTPVERSFLYMPFMHSESLMIHQMALELYKKNGIESNLDFEIKHKNIIERFGRYPHRNRILGRQSTKAEEDFLKQPGSGF